MASEQKSNSVFFVAALLVFCPCCLFFNYGIYNAGISDTCNLGLEADRRSAFADIDHRDAAMDTQHDPT